MVGFVVFTMYCLHRVLPRRKITYAQPTIRLDSVTLLRYCSAITRQLRDALSSRNSRQRISGTQLRTWLPEADHHHPSSRKPRLSPRLSGTPPRPDPKSPVMFKSLLTPEQWAEARRLRSEGATFAALGKQFGIAVSTISHRARREGWPSPAGAPAQPDSKSKASPPTDTTDMRRVLARRVYRVMNL